MKCINFPRDFDFLRLNKLLGSTILVNLLPQFGSLQSSRGIRYLVRREDGERFSLATANLFGLPAPAGRIQNGLWPLF
jgi:hypothetical protein